MMTFGVYLLTTLDVSHPGYRRVVPRGNRPGLGFIMPTATLAVQSTVERGMLGVATSATQFIRSIGSTVGTAVIGSIVTKGYAEGLRDNAFPPQAPGRLVASSREPAGSGQRGRGGLTRAASAFPGGAAREAGHPGCARGPLRLIHDGFVFVLFVGFAIGAALLMREHSSRRGTARRARTARLSCQRYRVRAGPRGGVAEDAKGSGDEAYATLLDSIGAGIDPAGRRGAAIALSGLADRIESSNGRYPNLLHAAAGTGEQERRRRARARRLRLEEHNPASGR